MWFAFCEGIYRNKHGFCLKYAGAAGWVRESLLGEYIRIIIIPLHNHPQAASCEVHGLAMQILNWNCQCADELVARHISLLMRQNTSLCNCTTRWRRQQHIAAVAATTWLIFKVWAACVALFNFSPFESLAPHRAGGSDLFCFSSYFFASLARACCSLFLVSTLSFLIKIINSTLIFALVSGVK